MLDNLAYQLYYGVYCLLFIAFFLYHLVMNKVAQNVREGGRCPIYLRLTG